MELNNIKKVVDISDDFKTGETKYITNQVNQALATGWMLIEIYKASNNDPECPGQSVHYVLGTLDNGAEVPSKYPKEEFI